MFYFSYETIDNAGQKLKPSQDVHPEASIVTRRQTHSFKEKTIEPQAKQRSKESYEDGSDSSESVQSTRSDEGVGGLPLVPTFERLASTFVVRQETFHLPAKKRKKPQNATQETLDYLNLTNKAKKKSRDQSLGVSKRTLYSQEMDDDKTDSDSTFKAPTMGARRRLRSSSENEPQAVERSSNSKNLPEKSSHQISEEPIKKSSRISRSSKNVVLTRSQSSTDEEIPETETVPVEVVQKQVAKKPAQKSVESSDSDVESVNKLPKNKKSTISQPFMRQKYARIVQPETCDKEMTEKEYRMTPVKIVLQRLSTTESCQKTVRPSSEEDLPANQRNDDNLSDTFQSPSSVSSFASEVATPVKNKSLNKETAHSEKSSNIIEIVAANNFQEQSQVKVLIIFKQFIT